MLRRVWKPAAGAALLVGAPTYYYYCRRSKSSTKETFDLSVRVQGPDGKPTREKRVMPLLPKDQIEARLKEHAETVRTQRPGGIIWNQHTAYLAANAPIEDAHASNIVERDLTDPSAPGDLLFYAVMDGHGGFHTSRLLSHILLPAVALGFSTLINEPSSVVPKGSFLQDLISRLRLKPSAAPPTPFDSNPSYVSSAIQTAFQTVDAEIIDAPLRLLAQELSKKQDSKGLPDLSQHTMALASMLPALSGSCALLALIDTAHRNLYVACTGDSRAVAGVWEESEDGKGSWRVDVLTDDQTGRNPNELKRMQSEHPSDEAETVIVRGRVLGGLEPSRAFGDARYKWSREVQAILNKVFLEGNKVPMRSTPPLLKTPPYVTARPEVTHRKLDFLPDPTNKDGFPKSKSALRFLVLATDGLWDELSSEDVVSLVGGFLAGLRGTISKSSLSKLVPTASGSTVEGKDKRRRDNAGSWAFVDDNISTHLIRNAFGGGDEMKLRQMLSIPAPLSRNYRDDVTCTVVFWEEGKEEAVQAATFSAEEQEEKSVRAKL
ncbi:unnamed protein product [Somion occarium]|uniref:PPM-type phosphatase domain-containing protein n=1 Tax=Somion occarium TaxID=3059160 RepID=A0ABP1D4B8_9APHY